MEALFTVCCGLRSQQRWDSVSSLSSPRMTQGVILFKLKICRKTLGFISKCAYQHALFTYLCQSGMSTGLWNLFLPSSTQSIRNPCCLAFTDSPWGRVHGYSGHGSLCWATGMSSPHYPPSLLQGAAGRTVTSKQNLILLSSILRGRGK